MNALITPSPGVGRGGGGASQPAVGSAHAQYRNLSATQFSHWHISPGPRKKEKAHEVQADQIPTCIVVGITMPEIWRPGLILGGDQFNNLILGIIQFILILKDFNNFGFKWLYLNFNMKVY